MDKLINLENLTQYDEKIKHYIDDKAGGGGTDLIGELIADYFPFLEHNVNTVLTLTKNLAVGDYISFTISAAGGTIQHFRLWLNTPQYVTNVNFIEPHNIYIPVMGFKTYCIQVHWIASFPNQLQFNAPRVFDQHIDTNDEYHFVDVSEGSAMDIEILDVRLIQRQS